MWGDVGRCGEVWGGARGQAALDPREVIGRYSEVRVLAHLGLGGDHHDVLDAHLGRRGRVGLGQAHDEEERGDEAF